jgi:cytochrome c oxidase subunit IV
MSADSHGRTPAHGHSHPPIPASAQAAQAHVGAVHEHPTWHTYKWVALILTAITVVEVWLYYLPSFVSTPYFVPTLLILSAAKFTIVVMFYMHLRYDHPLFRALFTGPLAIGVITIFALLLLFAKLVPAGGGTAH